MNSSQEKLGEMPIGKLLLTMSVPMMVSMFIQALYNIVDSMFVAKLTEDALTAVSLAYPLQSIMAAVSVGTGVGVNALVSRSLGEGNRTRAEKAANVQIFLGVCYTAVTVLVGIFFSRRFFSNQTDVQSIIDYGEQYVSIVCVFSIGLYFSQGFEKLLVATGNSTQSMISQAAGAVINIVLDPIFIFGIGPVPAFGVRGAAIATVIGQWAAAGLAFFFNCRYNQATRFRFGQLLPDLKILKFIYSVGIPSMITVGLTAVMSYGMNSIMLKFSTTAAAVFGIWLKLQNFGFMPVFGMNNGTIAIYSYNNGAKRNDRVLATFKLAMTVGICVTLIVTLLYELLPVTLLGFFSASDFMLSFGVQAIRVCSLSLVFGAVSVIISAACQSLGRARYTLIINICRQFVIQLLVAWLLSLRGELSFVWWAPLIAEALTAIIAVFLCRNVLGKLNS